LTCEVSLTFEWCAEFGMEKLDAQIVEWTNRYRVSMDTWLLPPKPAMYLRLVPEEKVYYYKVTHSLGHSLL
jgi:hypothetical protein